MSFKIDKKTRKEKRIESEAKLYDKLKFPCILCPL